MITSYQTLPVSLIYQDRHMYMFNISHIFLISVFLSKPNLSIDALPVQMYFFRKRTFGCRQHDNDNRRQDLQNTLHCVRPVIV